MWKRLITPVLALVGFFGLSVLTAQVDTLTFHGDRQRTGWRSNEVILTPANVSSGTFGPLWNSPQFDSVTIGGTTYAPHLYASPLYADSVNIATAKYTGTFRVVFAASSNGFVYAVSAFTTGRASPVPAGTILWSARLGTAAVVPTLDGGVPLGILSDPIIDMAATPPRLYAVSTDATAGWQVFALDISNGSVLPGWPLQINNSTLAPINQNGPTVFQPESAMSQRGSLNLSPDGKLLYVPFGAYGDGGAGWMVAMDTTTPGLASAFAGAPSSVAFANGGMWGSGGAAVDAQGNVYVITGNGTTANETTPGYWGQSVLVWKSGSPLALGGTYTPWNYCQMDSADIDLAGGAPVVLPSLASTGTSTPNLLTFGGKQGNIYLLDRHHLHGSLTVRQGCGTNASLDTSLLPPGNQPQFGRPGPPNVFGPYSDTLANADYAKARSTPAYFQGADGTNYIFATGSSKLDATSTTTVPPCIARLKIVTPAGHPAYVAVDQYEKTLSLLSPGSPIITSNGSANAILWVLVANVLRSASLLSSSTPHPILYALDPLTLHILWQSTPAQLNVGGKYNTPATARGVVFVGTDRIQAFAPTLNQAPALTSANSTTFVVGTLGSFTVTTKGFPRPSLTETGALPRGVAFVDNHNGMGTLSGTPAAGTAGMYHLVFTAANRVGSNATQNFTLTVNAAPPPAPVLSAISPASGKPGQTLNNVKLTGTNLSGATINALNGITLGNVVATSTQVTATFAIAANAATGARNVSVTTAGGKSNSVTFTVNPRRR
jgi:hypothetical protein